MQYLVLGSPFHVLYLRESCFDVTNIDWSRIQANNKTYKYTPFAEETSITQNTKRSSTLDRVAFPNHFLWLDAYFASTR